MPQKDKLIWKDIMATQKPLGENLHRQNPGSTLTAALKTISEKCINCELCKKECEFLKKYGKPKEIADAFDPFISAYQAIAFECSLCGLCAAVCPVNIDPSGMFLEMRCEAVRHGSSDFPEHAGILKYEKRGTSKRYTYYALPDNCDSIFFPGCTLPGTRPDKTIKLYEHMRKGIPTLGIVLDCCTKPSHDLGREAYFNAMFGEMRNFLITNHIRDVYVACPSCYQVFSQYGKAFTVKTVYEFMAKNGLPSTKQLKQTVSIHDPCSVRFEEQVPAAVRKLTAKQGLTIEEMDHHGEKTICCGEGGAVGFVNSDLASNWSNFIKKEANGKRMITYCAGCENMLGRLTPTSHIIDLLFEPEAFIAGKVKVSRPPFTYLNRMRLKARLKKTVNASVIRERPFIRQKEGNKKGWTGRILLLMLIIGAIFTARVTGATRYLEQEVLRQWIQSYGALAPVIYMVIYTVAPALLLPGLPITIAGGILFGPLWGVVYTIIGSTLGACVAFLTSRYIAGKWIESKLKSPRWRRLDEGVECHGWKVVAFTRLIPLFPFNLLNYAFGLTKVKFVHYAAATFIFMLPACIAYIVFSSSLLDLLRGEISLAFVAGLVLVALVSIIPFLYRRYKAEKGMTDPL